MSWSWYSQLTDSFKRRAGRYLINRYLGPFLEEGILLDQLTVDGSIKLRNVALNTDHINSMLEDTEAPIEFVDGFIQELSVTVPWSNLLKENCFFEIRGLTITCQVKKRTHPSQLSASIFHSMCESFSSKDVAEDCLRQNDITDSPSKNTSNIPASPPTSGDETVLGVEVLAQAIDSIIMRVKVVLIDTTFRVEYVPTIAPRGLAMEIKVGNLKYSGEIPGAKAGEQEPPLQPAQLTTSTLKKIFFEDVTLLTDEFSFHREDEEDGKTTNDQTRPLPIGVLAGVQELVLRFVDTDHYGLPRSIEEVEFNLGPVILHAFPHQIHTVMEIMSAFAVPSSTAPDHMMGKESDNTMAFLNSPEARFGLESMLQESMYHKPMGLANDPGWSTGEDITTQSTEFHPMPRVAKKSSFMNASTVSVSEKSVTPAIKVQASSLIAVLVEKDEGVGKLGGESNKILALEKMLTMAEKFFKLEPPSVYGIWDLKRQEAFHAKLEDVCNVSRLQVVGAPLSVNYEEGTHVGSSFGAAFLMKMIMTIGRVSLKEVIVPMDESHSEAKIDLIKFRDSPNPDFRMVYEELPDENPGCKTKTKISMRLALSPCTINFDPGFVDRIYMLMFYAEMDPSCLVTPAIGLLHDVEDGVEPSLAIGITCPQLDLNFFVPKVDMRKPTEMTTEEFVASFWARQIHPELFQLRLQKFELSMRQEAGAKSPIVLSFTTDFMDILFRESETSDKLPLFKARKSGRNSEQAHKKAARISITVCMDDSQKLQGKFDSSERIKTNPRVVAFDTSDHFFGGATGVSGEARLGGFSNNRGNRIVEEQVNIKAALEHSLSHNNIMVDIFFDEVSIVLPNKHIYEVIYNRLGNDMLLWLPVIFSVKDVLYNQPIPDPLRDPDVEFSHCYSGSSRLEAPKALEDHMTEKKDENIMTGSIYDTFPKSKFPGAIFIHTDTCVSLALNKAHATVCSPIQANAEDELYFFVAVIDKLNLLTVVGLERDPEICLLSLKVKDGKVSFGPSLGVHDPNGTDFVSRLHFNEHPSPKVLPLFRTSEFKTRAWPNTYDKDLIQLTTKILFDSNTNFKTITLALFLTEGSVVASSPGSVQPLWINWLADYFTVVEYPVTGYIPPAILTEMHFDLRHCTLDINYLTPGQLTLTLGHVKINCCLLDTGTDVNISVSAEDLGLFVSSNETAISHLKSSICILDVDSLDLAVNLREKPRAVLDVNAAVQLVRIRTCVDTIILLASMASCLPSEVTATSSREASGQRDVISDAYAQQEIPDDVVPDLADAMAELEIEADAAEAKDETPSVRRKSKMTKTKGGAQVFFFPDESQKMRSLERMGMTESVYVQQYHTEPTSDEDFCILDDVGSGFGNKPTEPSVNVLDPSGSVSLIENHFSLAKDKSHMAIDYLKTPKGFPKFQARITLKHLSLLWQIYGGNDFGLGTTINLTMNEPTAATASKRAASEPATNSAEGLKCRGGQSRKNDQLLEVYLSKISAQHELYPVESREASRQILIINSFEVRDKLVTSDINKLLHLYSNKLRPRQSNANMFSIKCVNLRPDPEMPLSEESVVNVSLQPLRINIDQETLFFIVELCSAFLPNAQVTPKIEANAAGDTTIRYSQGLQAVEIQPPDEMAIEANEQALYDQEKDDKAFPEIQQPQMYTKSEDAIYIRSFTFARDVPIRIDYSAKYMDLAHGVVAGLLAGLTSLNCSELTLKKVHYRNGISGLDKLLTLLVTEWLADIRQNQIPNILGGVGPMHSLLQLVQGIKDLFMMPVEQYQKDGRLLRGIQKGANSFTSSTAMSLLDFTNKLLGVIKFAAEMAFDIMSPESCVVQGKLPHPNINRNALRRPADMREGMFNAFAVIQEGMEETARTVIQNVIEDHNRRGLTGAVGGILRQVPSNLVRPVILATAATSNVLEGVISQVAPESRKEDEEKWKNAQSQS